MWSWIFSTRDNSQITTPATTTPPATAPIPAINPPTEARSSTMTHPSTYTNSTTVFPLTATTAAASPSTSLPLPLTEDVPAITTPESTPSPLSQLRNGVTTTIEQGTIVDNHNPRRMHFRIHNRRRDRSAPGNFSPGSFPLPTEAQFQRLFHTLRTNIRLGIMSQFVELVYDDMVAAPVVGTVPITQAASTTRASSEVPILQTPPSTIPDAHVAVSAVGSAPAAAFAIPSLPNVRQIISTTPAVNANTNATPAHRPLPDAVQKTQKVGNVAKTLLGPSIPTPAVRRRNPVEAVVNTPPSPNVLQNPVHGARATDINALLRMEIDNITRREPAARIPRHQGPAPLNDFVVTHVPATQGESSTASSSSGIRHRQRGVDAALQLESEQSVQWGVSAGSSSSQQHRRGFQTVLGLKPAIKKLSSAGSSNFRDGLQRPRVTFAEPVAQGESSPTSPSLQNQPRRPRVAFAEPVVNGESSADSPSLQSRRHRATLEVEPARGAPASGPQHMSDSFLDPPPSYSPHDPNATYFAGIPPSIARVSRALENLSRPEIFDAAANRPDPPMPVRRSTRNKQPSGAASGSRASRPRDTPWTRVPFEPHDHTLHPPYNRQPRHQPAPQQPTANGRAHEDENIPSHSNYGFWQASQAAIPSSNQVTGTRKRTVETALGEVDVNGSAKRSRRS